MNAQKHNKTYNLIYVVKREALARNNDEIEYAALCKYSYIIEPKAGGFHFLSTSLYD
ncbi:hypothetical protein [Paenisporosarcina sp. TG-14]|uniref:hypothetical protein n=1 Tax=Paenisporosarcina sp. TG-14 TaxID=1231057 RepID=UPI000308DBEC|nr:hypothetical protein [Paenisporosarcina sp. TG-14]